MRCFEAVQEQAAPSLCMRAIQTARPRCTHLLSLRCHEANALKALWQEQDGQVSLQLARTFPECGLNVP
jgi:hypothetical protein